MALVEVNGCFQGVSRCFQGLFAICSTIFRTRARGGQGQVPVVQITTKTAELSLPQVRVIDKIAEVPVTMEQQAPMISTVQKAVEENGADPVAFVRYPSDSEVQTQSPPSSPSSTAGASSDGSDVEVQIIDKALGVPVTMKPQVPMTSTAKQTVEEVPPIQILDGVEDVPVGKQGQVPRHCRPDLQRGRSPVRSGAKVRIIGSIAEVPVTMRRQVRMPANRVEAPMAESMAAYKEYRDKMLLEELKQRDPSPDKVGEAEAPAWRQLLVDCAEIGLCHNMRSGKEVIRMWKEWCEEQEEEWCEEQDQV